MGKRLGMKVIDKHELRRLMKDEDAQVIEVLPEESYVQEHIEGAFNIPLKELTARVGRRLDRRRPVVTYCNDFL